MFPEYRDLISQLKASDLHFRHLFDQHNELDKKIRNLEGHVDHAHARQEEIEVLTLKQVMQAKVIDIIETLKAHNRNHALVVDTDPLNGRQMVRGIFSASQIARQLGVATQIHSVAKTFAQIEAVLAS